MTILIKISITKNAGTIKVDLLARAKQNGILSGTFSEVNSLNRYSIPSQYNWKEDVQPMVLPTVHEYIELAEHLMPYSHRHIAEILIKAGYINEGQKENFIQQLTDLPKKKWNDIANLAVETGFIKISRHAEMLKKLQEMILSADAGNIARKMVTDKLIPGSAEARFEKSILGLKQNPSLQLDGIAVSYRIKSKDSASKKLLEPSINQNPAHIGDYKGYQITTSSLRDTIRMVNAVLDDPAMSSRKCKFMEPSDEGDRRHLSHHIISDGEVWEKDEIQIVPIEIDRVSKITHKLKDAERSLASASLAISTSLFNGKNRYATRMTRCESEIRIVRTAINDTVCDKAGYNFLVSQGKERHAPSENLLSGLDARTKKLIKTAEDNAGGVSIKHVISGSSKGSYHEPVVTRALN